MERTHFPEPCIQDFVHITGSHRLAPVHRLETTQPRWGWSEISLNVFLVLTQHKQKRSVSPNQRDTKPSKAFFGQMCYISAPSGPVCHAGEWQPGAGRQCSKLLSGCEPGTGLFCPVVCSPLPVMTPRATLSCFTCTAHNHRKTRGGSPGWALISAAQAPPSLLSFLPGWVLSRSAFCPLCKLCANSSPDPPPGEGGHADHVLFSVHLIGIRLFPL